MMDLPWIIGTLGAIAYDWGATNQQRPGKYTGDGVYNAHVWDTQIGCAALIKAMMAIDTTIAFDGAAT